ncbi:hypothetical protein BOX15_Mlig001773g8 [Macrostomum lignano]|uniref:Uncharacterized protein n=1 Tax=Macrostomum lignano TaxID=282301 RepID=A0A267DHW5_9PLAT|nr:hypothetical protein BOX15_Mlig001773g8 [Macrostomum lignano]
MRLLGTLGTVLVLIGLAAAGREQDDTQGALEEKRFSAPGTYDWKKRFSAPGTYDWRKRFSAPGTYDWRKRFSAPGTYDWKKKSME